MSAWWGLRWPDKAASNSTILLRIRPRANCASCAGSLLPANQSTQDRPSGDAHDIGGDTGEFDVGVLQRLLDAIDQAGLILDQSWFACGSDPAEPVAPAAE